MSKKLVNVKDLFSQARAEGDLSTASFRSLTVNADIGQRIQAGLGIAPGDVAAAEVVLVTLMVDDSGSIRFAGNADAVRDGHNLVLDSLLASRQMAEVLVHTRYLNGHVLYPYRPLADAVRMTRKNYDPTQGTPLYDQAAVLLGTVLAKAKEFEQNGVPVRTVTLLITDGADVHSRNQTAASIRSIVEDMQKSEGHIIAGMGIDDGSTPFAEVFREMGIPDEWILTPGATSSEIHGAFQVFSQSVVQASQSVLGFSQAAMKGFTGSVN